MQVLPAPLILLAVTGAAFLWYMLYRSDQGYIRRRRKKPRRARSPPPPPAP